MLYIMPIRMTRMSAWTMLLNSLVSVNILVLLKGDFYFRVLLEHRVEDVLDDLPGKGDVLIHQLLQDLFRHPGNRVDFPVGRQGQARDALSLEQADVLAQN